jgi:hypothetical protein
MRSKLMLYEAAARKCGHRAKRTAADRLKKDSG